jgi:hypothetical protein
MPRSMPGEEPREVAGESPGRALPRGLAPAVVDIGVLAFALAVSILTTEFDMPLIDDALITLRCSLNLVAGHGLVFNPGDHVLGTSSPVYALVLAALIPLFDDPVAIAIRVGGTVRQAKPG